MKIMSDVMIRELNAGGCQNAGAAIVLSTDSQASLGPAENNVHGETKVTFQQEQEKVLVEYDSSCSGLTCRHRLRECCQTLWTMIQERLPAPLGFSSFRELLGMQFGILVGWLRGLYWSMRHHSARLHFIIMQRGIRQWQSARTQQQIWLRWRHCALLNWMALRTRLLGQLRVAGDVMCLHEPGCIQYLRHWVRAAEVARWRDRALLSWSALRSHLLALLGVAGDFLVRHEPACIQYLRHWVRVAQVLHIRFCSWLAQRVIHAWRFAWSCLPIWGIWSHTNTGPGRQNGLRVFGCRDRVVQSLKDAAHRRYQALHRYDSGFLITEDLMFLWAEPRARALLVALLFALAVLGDIVAVSSLPAWCASAEASDMEPAQMLACATLSHSVLSSLKGIAAVP